MHERNSWKRQNVARKKKKKSQCQEKLNETKTIKWSVRLKMQRRLSTLKVVGFHWIFPPSYTLWAALSSTAESVIVVLVLWRRCVLQPCSQSSATQWTTRTNRHRAGYSETLHAVCQVCVVTTASTWVLDIVIATVPILPLSSSFRLLLLLLLLWHTTWSKQRVHSTSLRTWTPCPPMVVRVTCSGPALGGKWGFWKAGERKAGGGLGAAGTDAKPFCSFAGKNMEI